MTPSPPFDMSAELAALKHSKNNHALQRLPPHHTIRRRPLQHAPIADARSGAKNPKVVYVSRRTPVIAAIKRVKKMLAAMEKRALVEVGGASLGAGDVGRKVALANDRIAQRREEVLVKASGRAMEQALRVGEWFRNQEKEFLCHVEVRPGSVSVVDDIVEVEGDEAGVQAGGGDGAEVQEEEEGGHDGSRVECGDTTLELLGDVTISPVERASQEQNNSSLDVGFTDTPVKTSKRKRKKRKRPVYEEDDLPEARLRWIKTVEVAVSLQG